MGEISISDAIQQTVAENVDIVPSNMNLSGAEIELVSLEDRESIVKENLSKIKNNYDFITQDDGNGIKPRASSTVLNGYYWETYYNSIRSKVFVYAQVTYNANTGAYMSRTKALGKFSVKGSNTSACGVDQSLSSATVYKSASVPYVNYHPAAFIKYKDGTYRYMKDWKFNVKCYSNAQPKPYM